MLALVSFPIASFALSFGPREFLAPGGFCVNGHCQLIGAFPVARAVLRRLGAAGRQLSASMKCMERPGLPPQRTESEEFGQEVYFLKGEEFATWLKATHETYGKAAKAAGLTPQQANEA